MENENFQEKQKQVEILKLKITATQIYKSVIILTEDKVESKITRGKWAEYIQDETRAGKAQKNVLKCDMVTKCN